MPLPPKDPNPKPSSGGDPIRGGDWNDLIDELQSATSEVPGNTIQTGTGTAVITVGNNSVTVPTTFSTAYPVGTIPRVIAAISTGTGFGAGHHWNGLTLVSPDAAVITWIIPAALTELLGLTLHRANVFGRGINRSVIWANVVTPGVGNLKAQYSTDGGNTWLDFSNTIDVAFGGVTVSSRTGGGIAGVGQDDIQLRIVGLNGDGITPTEFGNIGAEWRYLVQGGVVSAHSITRTGFTLGARIPFPSDTVTNIPYAWLAFLP